MNAEPHLGTAYEKIGADVLARYHRLAGDDVFFLMGNDEHSQNVAAAARRQGLDPLAYCDSMEPRFRAAWASLEISFDDFIRTTEPRHVAAVTEILTRVKDAGDVYQGKYEGWYCVGCEAFVPEKDLVEGNCPNHGKKPDWISEDNWFFRLSKYTDVLAEHYEKHPEFVRPESYRNQMLSVLKDGLTDISISRAGSDWGVPFPFDPTTVVYVWFDALINYLSGVGFPGEEHRKWWPADVHVIGKDITRFHCLVWPAMLLSAGVELPKTISVHGFLSVDGKKLSKSLGTIVNPADVVAEWGADPVRFLLLREMGWGKDGDYSEERLEDRYTHDLGNDLGNLLNRVLNMTHRYADGCPGAIAEPDQDDPLRAVALAKRSDYVAAMEDLDPQGAINAAWEIVTRANAYVEEKEPWRLVKEEDGRAKVAPVLANLLEALRHILVYLHPVMPGKTAEGYVQLGLGDISTARLTDLDRFEFPSGVTVGKGEPLFPRKE